MSKLSQASRTCYCGELRPAHEGRSVVLKGWAHYRRDHGGLIFVDLRDREGLAQVVFDPDVLTAEQFATAHRLKSEDVLAIGGQVRLRPEDKINPNLATGGVEVLVDALEVLSRAETLPFKVDEHGQANEDLRLKYRFLDLRRSEIQGHLIARSRYVRTVRDYLDSHGLLEIETPILTRSTPEGARDFLVPSRVNQGSFYALPQSPQLFKQILMVAGFDRYYQIARCFRDEDLRANRQPEFTQIDIEMSFVTREEIYALSEGMMQAIYREVKGIEIDAPFRRFTYDEAMLRFGSDKPDLRFGLEIADVGEALGEGCNFQVFNRVIEKGGVVRAIRVAGGGEKFSNTQLKPGGELPEYAARYGAKGLAWFRAVSEDGRVTLESSIKKFFEPACLEALAAKLEAKPGDLILIVADEPQTAAIVLGQLRLHLGRKLDLIDPSAIELCWITDFPWAEFDKTAQRWQAVHHPFTSPRLEDLDKIESDPGAVKSLAYDLSLNGEEVGGGSIRIHRRDVQERVFSALGIAPADAEHKFGFLLDALRYGAPPHGGIAFGVDRMLMAILGLDSIRDVIAFPKTQSGTDLMTAAPAEVEPGQLDDLGLRLAPMVEKRLKERAEKPSESERGHSEKAATSAE